MIVSSRSVVSPHHEGPSRRLVQMAEQIASLRGSPIRCFGSSALARLDEQGRKRWLMEADKVLYLHAPRLRSWDPSSIWTSTPRGRGAQGGSHDGRIFDSNPLI